MTPEAVIEVGTRALTVAVMLSVPLLLAALVVGLVVGLFQAATQINEVTLSFVPKLAILVVVLIAAGPWMLALLTGYTRELIESIPAMIG